jgi:outer membrane protein OmpA-like peptidoglycan-associated protein
MTIARQALAAAVGFIWMSSGTGAQDLGPMMPNVGAEIVTAFTNSFGPDAESYFRFQAVTPQWITINYTSSRGVVALRTIDNRDRLSARTYVIGFARNMPTMIPGTTSLGISGQSLVELREKGQTTQSLIYDAKLSQIGGTLTLVDGKAQMSLLVQGQLVSVPAVHASGNFSNGRVAATGDFFFLDNKNNPLMLQSIIRFSNEATPRTEKIVRVTAGAAMASEMEQALATRRAYDIYGIHFDFDKATIREESGPLIRDIATTLQNNPLWSLMISGFTDSIGDPAYNLKLSQQRAGAVRSALVGLGIAPERLQSQGFGSADPKADNATLQGRAMNRRVELKRTDR